MKHTFGNTIVIALGGSIVHPDHIDVEFLKKLKPFVSKAASGGKKIVLVIGGGKLARLFQDAAHGVSNIVDEDKDWLGIHATRLNAHLLRTIFKDIAGPVVLDERFKIKKPKCPLTIASGWRPGWSTDYVAAQLAADFGAREVVIAGKPAFVYDKDPHKFSGAVPLPELTWKEYKKLIPHKWIPGLNAPVDPVAAALAEKEKLRAIIINGKDLKNFGALLNGKEFKGSIISDR
ncbi:MAG: UMP kinase [Candidatus Liptonbacteria bacterium]